MTRADDARHRHALAEASSPFGERLDDLIAPIFPKWAMNRSRARGLLAAYRAATPGRNRRSPTNQGGTEDSHLPPASLWSLREQVRELERDNVIVKGLLDRCVDNVIGNGFKVQPQTAEPGWNEEAKGRFTDWSRRECDIRGMCSLRQLARIGFRRLKADGDFGVLLDDETGSLQAIEADRIATPAKYASDPAVVNGIRLDRQGRPLVFYIGEDPGVVGKLTFYLHGNFAEVPRQSFIHVYDPTRFSQTRGRPALTSAIDYFAKLDEYVDAELVGSKVAAMIALFIEQEGAGASAMGEGETDEEGNTWEKMQTGQIRYGRPGEKAVVVSGNRPNSNFYSFMEIFLRLLGQSVDMPLELLLLDFSKTNLSSARAALQQAWQAFECDQLLMIEQFYSRVWSWRIGKFISDGQLKPQPRALLSDWTPRPFPWIDLVEDVQARILRQDRGLEDYETGAQELGYTNFEELMTARARQRRRIKEIATEHQVTVEDLIGSPANSGTIYRNPGDTPKEPKNVAK